MMSSLVTLLMLGFVEPSETVDYVKEIKPILAAKCFACHGALQQKGDLRLDTAKAMLEGGTHGPVIVLGKAGTSLLLRHILGLEGTRRMPPPTDGEPLKDDQVAKLRRWIEQGAKAPADEKPEADPRDHWSFRSPRVTAAPGKGNVIDAWLAAERDKRGLKPQPPADPRTLLRRVYLDLIGLPPTLEEQEAFLVDAAADPYEKVVDRLLASPRHGERWARHWMDIWRYSDPWGLGAEIRSSQKHIWHWRDWIIESLNQDKGYDQMVRDMLAADELAPNDLDRLRATGYLVRQYFKFNRQSWLDETVEHTSKAFLGLTLNCAKCHDHKYDPLSQTDFYRMRAFFEPYQIRTDMIRGEVDLEKDGIVRAFDCNLDAPTYVFTRGDDRQPKKDKAISPDLPKLLLWAPLDIQPIKLPTQAYWPQLREQVLENHLAITQRQVDAASKALKVAEKNADADAIALAKNDMILAQDVYLTQKARRDADLAKLSDPGSAAEQARAAAHAEKRLAVRQAEDAVFKVELEVKRADAAKKPEAEKKLIAAKAVLTKAQKLAENPGTAYTSLKGAIKTLESNVETEVSRNRPFPTTSTGRRSALAAWMTDRRNPLTARVAVNHLWARHFGTPLVATVFDFGRKGAMPTHPELLDALAVEFMEHGWSMKHLHRLIVTSQAYQMSSSSVGAAAKNLEADAENRYYWRRHQPRMEAQVVRDSLLHLAGKLDDTLGGPPIPIAQELSPRRSLYFLHSNNDSQRFLAQFDDAAVRECYRRSESIVPQQALALANSKLVLTATAAIAERLNQTLAKATDDEFIRTSFALLLGSEATQDEIAECVSALAEWRKLAAARPDAALRARRNLVHALVNHHDFITIR